MNDLRQAKINALVAEHNLPSDIIGRCVAADGIVDNDKLGLALQTRAFAQSGIANANQAEIERLIDEYYVAQDNRDPARMIRLQSRIFELGGRMTARKKV
jgi:hypothetical protein